jgi:hypothetical protein
LLTNLHEFTFTFGTAVLLGGSPLRPRLIADISALKPKQRYQDDDPGVRPSNFSLSALPLHVFFILFHRSADDINSGNHEGPKPDCHSGCPTRG